MKWCLTLLYFLVVIVLVLFARGEGFGMSPGTMVQLQTSHVPTEEDLWYYKNVYPRMVAREIYNMTESDLH